MENLDVMVLKAARDWRCAGKKALLATVVRTWGSSPRPVGSIMVLGQHGAVAGSVSGGCIEDDLIARYSSKTASDALLDGPPTLVKYGIAADEAHKFGLPCGGTLELLLEFDPEPDALVQLVELLDRGSLVNRTVSLQDGQVLLHKADAPSELALTATHLRNTFGPMYRMLLIGAGQLAEFLASMAQSCGFAVTLCDPRTEYYAACTLDSVTITREMPDDAVVAFRPDRRSCVVALTHDPKLDDLALLEALNSDAFYVGAIGSRRNSDARRQRMIEHFEQTRESLSRLRGPIGIYIGSKTPPEIAVSVMAEILAVKNAVQLPLDMAVSNAKCQMEDELQSH